MNRRPKLALLFYKAMALYLHCYPKERAKLRKLLGKPAPKK